MHSFEIGAWGKTVPTLKEGRSTSVLIEVPHQPGQHEYTCRPHAAMMKGVVDLTTEVYKLTDMIGEAGDLPESNWSAIVEQRAKVVAMLEDHGCPAAGDAGNGDEEVRRDGD